MIKRINKIRGEKVTLRPAEKDDLSRTLYFCTMGERKIVYLIPKNIPNRGKFIRSKFRDNCLFVEV